MVQVCFAEPANFVSKLYSELLELLLDFLYDILIKKIIESFARTMEDLPALSARIYQPQKIMSGFVFIHHDICSLLQRNPQWERAGA
jgi:hypothetical protein